MIALKTQQWEELKEIPIRMLLGCGIWRICQGGGKFCFTCKPMLTEGQDGGDFSPLCYYLPVAGGSSYPQSGPETDTCSTHSRKNKPLSGSVFRKTTFHHSLSWWRPKSSHHVVRLLSPHTNTPVSQIQQVSGCLQNA